MQINAFIPISFKYIGIIYPSKRDRIVLQLQEEILPMVCERLTSIEELNSIDLFIDVHVDKRAFPSKCRIVSRSSTVSVQDSYEKILSQYLDSVSCDAVLGVNPLFPFVRRETYKKLIHDVKVIGFESSTTAIFGGTDVGNEHLKVMMESQHTPEAEAQNNKTDIGVAFCSKVVGFSAKRNRLKLPLNVHPIDTFELISLRKESDARLIELVISSGLHVGI